jgi:hypothetical protein
LPQRKPDNTGEFSEMITVRHGCVSPSSRGCEQRHIRGAGEKPARTKEANNQTLRRMNMKTVLSALLALSLLATVAAPASAADGYDTQGGRDVGQSSPL